MSGSGASRTLVVADGWALNDPFGSWVYWNRIPLAAVDRVEVVRGATGDLYGSDAHFKNTPKQPAIQDNRIPQVPVYHVGAGLIAETPRLATFYVQARFVGSQFEDDQNLITLDNYAVVDASA